MEGRKINRLIHIVREELRIIVAIGLGVFLFVLFFQPFPIELSGFNNNLLFIAGFGAIVFLIMLGIRMLFAEPVYGDRDFDQHIELPSYIQGFLMLVLSSVACIFYLQYVGNINITFFIAVKAVIICFIPPVALRLYLLYKQLSARNRILQHEKDNLHGRFEAYQKENMNRKIEFATDHLNENLILLPSDLICIKSADNYVEIIYKEEEIVKKKLTRNTMRNVEHKLKPWSVFIRCHRTCLVNTLLVQNLYKKGYSHHIMMKGYNEEIPVSRQYLFRLREALDKGQGRIEFTRPV